MDYLGISKFLSTPRPKKPWWELGFDEWPDNTPEPTEEDEVKEFLDPPGFRSWYEERSKRFGLDPNPDSPEHHYDYRAAFLQGAEPDETGHWPSTFKSADHPRRYLTGDGSTAEPWSGSGPRFDSRSGKWESPGAAPPRGLLDRVADRMSDLGYGGGEEARRTALRRALGAFGARLSAGAMKEGLGGIGAAVSEGLGAYQGGLAEQRQRRDVEEEIARRARGEQVQQEYMGALTQQMAGKGDEQARQLREAIAARKAMVEERKAYLATLPPDKRDRLAPLIGADPDQWNKFVYEAGAPPEPPKRDIRSGDSDIVEVGPDGKVKVLYKAPVKPSAPREPGAPTTRDFADGTERQWNPSTGAWDVIARKPAGGEKPYDRRAEATKIYLEALKDPAHAAYRAGSDSKPDVKATWQAAYEAAGAAAPPPPPRVDSTNDPVNDAPMANHARNKAIAALRRGAPEAAVLAELRKVGALNGFTPEQILAHAKRLAGGQ